MWAVEYYARPNGDQPVAEWLDALRKSDKRLKATMDVRISKLGQHGLQLQNTEMLKRITGGDRHLYELRGGAGRIAIYHDTQRATFVLLHGFTKKRDKESNEIGQARRLLREYLEDV